MLPLLIQIWLQQKKTIGFSKFVCKYDKYVWTEIDATKEVYEAY